MTKEWLVLTPAGPSASSHAAHLLHGLPWVKISQRMLTQPFLSFLDHVCEHEGLVDLLSPDQAKEGIKSNSILPVSKLLTTLSCRATFSLFFFYWAGLGEESLPVASDTLCCFQLKLSLSFPNTIPVWWAWIFFHSSFLPCLDFHPLCASSFWHWSSVVGSLLGQDGPLTWPLVLLYQYGPLLCLEEAASETCQLFWSPLQLPPTASSLAKDLCWMLFFMALVWGFFCFWFVWFFFNSKINFS